MATRKPTFDELLQQSREQSFYNSLPKDKSFDELLAEYGNQTLDDDYYNKAISGLSNAYTTDAWNVSAMGRRAFVSLNAARRARAVIIDRFGILSFLVTCFG